MMELLKAIEQSQAVYRLGWALLHTLWLGAVVAGVLAMALLILRRRSANARYLAACAALVMMVALPAATFFLVPAPAGPVQVDVNEAASQADGSADTTLQPPAMSLTKEPVADAIVGPVEPIASREKTVPPAEADEPPPTVAVIEEALAVETPKPPLLTRASQVLEPALPWVVLAWAVGVFILSLRQLAGWIAAERLRRLATRPAESDLIATVARLARAMRVSRPVKVLESVLVRVPTVVGWLQPVILLPAGLATGLSPQQLQAILAHELAHIRRYDYLVNLLQSLVETLLFYHPAVWFISRRIRAERENCCDDIAVAAGAERFSYAESLLHVAQRSLAARRGRRFASAAALGATGKPSQLRSRITRLLAGPNRQTTRLARSWPIVLVVVCIILVCSYIIFCANDKSAKIQTGDSNTPVARNIRLLGVQPDYSDDILDSNGNKIGEMFTYMHGNNGQWSELYRTFIFELPETDEPILPDVFLGIRTSREGRVLSSGQSMTMVEHEGKRLLMCRTTFPKQFTESGLFFDRQIPVDRVDFTLRFHHGPPGRNEFCFTGPFKPGTTVRADGEKSHTLTFKQDRHGNAGFHLSIKRTFTDIGLLIYDTSGKRHIRINRSGSWGSGGAEIDYSVPELPLRRIAKIVFGEKPQQRTFRNILVQYPHRPARNHAVFLDEMAKVLGRSVQDVADHSVQTADEAIKVMGIARGYHIQTIKNHLYSVKFSKLSPEKQKRLLTTAAVWAKSPYPRLRRIGVCFGLRWSGGRKFVTAALDLLDAKDRNVRRAAAGDLRRCKALWPKDIDRIKERVLAEDDPLIGDDLANCLTWYQTPASAEVLWELAKADEKRPWLWWPALVRLNRRGQIKDRAGLPKEIHLRLILAAGPRKGEEDLAEEAYGLLPELLSPMLPYMTLSNFSFRTIHNRLIEHVDRPTAMKAMVEFLRNVEYDHRIAWTIDKVAKRLNLWYATNFGALGWEVRQESEHLHKYDWPAIISGVVQWYDAGRWRKSEDDTKPQPEDSRHKDMFGPVVEKIVNTARAKKDSFIDFDTGRLLTPPEGLDLGGSKAGREARFSWCRQNRIDAWAHVYTQRSGGLWGFDMTVSPVPRQFWNAPTAKNIAKALKSAYTNGRSLETHGFISLPVTFAFRTREGAVGLLQIVGFTEKPRSVKIRYRMLKRPKADKPATKPATQPAKETTTARIAELITQLVSKNYKEREKAQQALVQIGIPAIPALKVATTDKDPERASRAKLALKEMEDRAWGEAVDGLQVRLRPLKSVWKSGQTPRLSLDLRNRGKKMIAFIRVAKACCDIEYDGHWYGWGDAITIAMPSSMLKPGNDLIDVFEVSLVNSWKEYEKGKARPFTVLGGKRLKLTLGKHTVRVRFRADGKQAVSNKVEMEIHPATHLANADQPDRGSKVKTGVDRKQIARLIEQLGDDKYRTRQAAQEELIRIGRPAVSSLKRSLKHEDLEIALRAAHALKEIDKRFKVRIAALRKAARDAAAKGDHVAATRYYIVLLDLQAPSAEDQVALLKEGYTARTPRSARTFAQFLEQLADQAHTVATQSFMRPARDLSAPTIKQNQGSAFELLAQALNGTSVSFAINQQGQWCLYESGDPNRKVTYGASGGVICTFQTVNRRADRKWLWVLGRLMFEPAVQRHVMAIQSEMKVLEAIDDRGRKVPTLQTSKPRWDPSGQVSFYLGKQDPPARKIAKVRVGTAVAVCTKWVTLTAPRLDHDKPITLAKDNIKIEIAPLRVVERGGQKTWQLPIDVRRSLGPGAKAINTLKDKIYLVTTDGKLLPASGASRTLRSANHEKIRIRFAAGASNPAATSLIIREPAAIKIVPFELTFRDIPIIDR